MNDLRERFGAHYDIESYPDARIALTASVATAPTRDP